MCDDRGKPPKPEAPRSRPSEPRGLRVHFLARYVAARPLGPQRRLRPSERGLLSGSAERGWSNVNHVNPPHGTGIRFPPSRGGRCEGGGASGVASTRDLCGFLSRLITKLHREDPRFRPGPDNAVRREFFKIESHLSKCVESFPFARVPPGTRPRKGEPTVVQVIAS